MIDIAEMKPTSREAWGAEARATLSLAWPLILTNLAQISLATTDVIMMGWLGPQQLAAGALGANLNFAFVIFAIGLVTATAPLIAIELGRKRHSVRDVRRTVRQGLWTAGTISVPIWIILWQAESIFLALGQEPALAHAAASYLHTLQWGVLPFLCYIVLRSFVSGLERPMSAMWIGALSVPLNAFLVWTLMFGHLGLPALGLPGAGIGTTVTNTFMFSGLALLVSVDRRFRRYHLFGRFWRGDAARYREIWKVGLPIAAALAFEVTIFNATTFLMGLISAAAIAAYAIALQIASVTFMVPLGLNQAATVRVGRAYGARDGEGIRLAGWTAYVLGLGFMCVTAATMLLAPRFLVGAFLDLNEPANAAVIGLAITFLAMAGLFQIFDGAQVIGSGMLRGLQDTRVPMIFCAIGYWGIGLPLGIILGFAAGLAGIGLWIGLAAGLAVVASLMTGRWILRERFGLLRRLHPASDVA